MEKAHNHALPSFQYCVWTSPAARNVAQIEHNWPPRPDAFVGLRLAGAALPHPPPRVESDTTPMPTWVRSATQRTTVPTDISDAGVITGYFNDQRAERRWPQSVRSGTRVRPLSWSADALPKCPPARCWGLTRLALPTSTPPGRLSARVFTNNVNSAAVQDAFVYDTSFHDLPHPCQPGSQRLAPSPTATAINDAGTVVGYDDFPDQGLTFPFRHVGTIGPFNERRQPGDL